MPDRWEVTVQYVVDGTTHERTFRGHRISAQVHPDPDPPRRANIRVYDKAGEVVESYQCNAETIWRRRIDEGSGT